MTKQTETAYRREWIKRYVKRNAPVTLAEVVDRASCLALESLSEDHRKCYWVIAKDLQALRQAGDIASNAIVFKKY